MQLTEETKVRARSFAKTSKRHLSGIIFILVGFLFLYYSGDSVSRADQLHLAFGGIMRTGFFLGIFLILLKGVFPHIFETLTERIADEPIATAVFCGMLAIAIAQVF